MRNPFILILTLHAIYSCNSIAISKDDAVIIGHVKGLPKIVYLSMAESYNKFIDSAVNKNDEFVFHIKTGKSFHPSLVSLSYIDGGKKINTLYIKNHILSTASQGYIMNAFMLEKGKTLLNGIVNIRKDSIRGTHIQIHEDSISIKSGPETDALFKTQMMDFGSLEADVAKRTLGLNVYKSIIKLYPSSEFLLSKIDENKSIMKKGELSILIESFNIDALETSTGRKLQNYLAAKIDNPILKNIILEDDSDKAAQIFNLKAKVNMIVVWASWCGPCRQEIPEIKRLFSKYNKNGLSILSISIDDNRDAWRAALTSEKMEWRQLIVPFDKKEIFNRIFEVASIPYVIFTDGDGKLITRFIGYEEKSIEIYVKIIDKELGI